MGIQAMIQNAIKACLEAESQRLLKEAYSMKPLHLGYFHSTVWDESSLADSANTVESTAIVVDETIKALPEGEQL